MSIWLFPDEPNNGTLDLHGDTIPDNFDYQKAYIELRKTLIEDGFATQDDYYPTMIDMLEKSIHYRKDGGE